MVSTQSDSDRPQRPTPADFDNFVPWASRQLEADYTVIITKIVQSKYVSAAGKDKTKPKAKTKVKTPTDSGSNAQVPSNAQIDSKSLNENDDQNPVYIETTYDENDELVRVKFLKNRNVPRMLIKIVALAIPYHRMFTSLIVSDGLQATTMHEISKFYSTNRITEICFDSNNLPINCHIILDNDIIKHLSLSKCNITDLVVKTIASKLTAPNPASTSLSVLNLSTNRITDVGVKYFAKMLRSNRQLSYLNLADNKITDEGAESILNTLTKFALTSEEAFNRSRSFISYLKEKNELILKMAEELSRFSDDKKISKRKQTKAVPLKKKLENEASVDMKTFNSTDGPLVERAEVVVEGILGPFKSPFGPENTEKGERVTYCLGNNTLSYLNLAFNNLSYCSVKILCDVLKSQNIYCRKPKGLINIRIEGNYLPEHCTEYQTIDDLLSQGLSKHNKNLDNLRKRKTSRSNM